MSLAQFSPDPGASPRFSASSVLLIVALTFVGVVTHSVPHEWGFSTVGALSLVAARYVSGVWLLVPVLATVLFIDALAGFYALPALVVVYLAYAAAAYAVVPLMSRLAPGRFALAALAQALAFYVVSNVAPMVMGYYPATAEGWLTCYLNGLPFLLKGVAANLIFGGLTFVAVEFYRSSRYAHRLASPQRH